MIENKNLLEHAIYNNNYYGTPKDWVLSELSKGRDVILEIEVMGAMKIRSHYPEACMVFVLPPSFEILKNRLVGRGTESSEIIEQRLYEAEREIGNVNKYNYIVINDNLSQATDEVLSVIKAEKCRIERNQEFISTYLEKGN